MVDKSGITGNSQLKRGGGNTDRNKSTSIKHSGI